MQYVSCFAFPLRRVYKMTELNKSAICERSSIQFSSVQFCRFAQVFRC